jgi:hypothetical protein
LTDEKESPRESIVCKHCKHIVGFSDPATDGWRIQKWNIGISSAPSMQAFTFSVQKWISARLLYLIENSGVRKFHVHPAQPSSSPSDSSAPIPSLLLWVFTPDLLFSSSISTPGRLDPTRSLKVFYQSQTWQPLKPGEPESASIDDVEFPADLYAELDAALRGSQRLLPPTARKFQGWHVALLERFEVVEAGMGYVEGNSGGGEDGSKEDDRSKSEDGSQNEDDGKTEDSSRSEDGSMSEDEGPRGRTTSRGD